MAQVLAKTFVLIVLICLLLQSVAGVQGNQYINSSEPAFLHDIGPQDERSDNPWAAVVTALVVAAVFYRGFHHYSRDDTSSD